MEVYKRGRAVVEICLKREYLEEVLSEMRLCKRIQEIQSDKFFDKVVTALRSRIKLVTGNYPNLVFRYDSTGRKHYRGDMFFYSCLNGRFSKTSPKTINHDDHNLIHFFKSKSDKDKCIILPSLDEITIDDFIQTIDLMSVQEILNL